jgi:integrase
MASGRNRLSAAKVSTIKEVGRHGDGGGLYLQVRPLKGAADGLSRSWVFRYRSRITGKLREKGLGPLADTSLAQARDLARDLRNAIRQGVDPLDAQRAALEAQRAEHSKRLTFAECADRYVAKFAPSWRSAKHAAQWRATLETYCEPINATPVADVDTAAVLRCLEPHWITRTETMTRVRQRMERVLDWAATAGYRRGLNPARWRGHLSNLLAPPGKVASVTPRASLPYAEAATFLAALRQREGLAARALELQLLTATRPGEASGARWEEIDLGAALWTIPAARMKSNRPHVVPLSAPAVALLRGLATATSGPVFPGVVGPDECRPITTAAGMKILKSLRPGLTAHGFRSTFRTWAADLTSYARDVQEAALAHVVKDKVEAAYRRTDFLAKRRRLMDDWAAFCESPYSADIIPIGRAIQP